MVDLETVQEYLASAIEPREMAHLEITFAKNLEKIICKELNKKMMRYDGIRYPNGNLTTTVEAKETVKFADYSQKIITSYIKNHKED